MIFNQRSRRQFLTGAGLARVLAFASCLSGAAACSTSTVPGGKAEEPPSGSTDSGPGPAGDLEMPPAPVTRVTDTAATQPASPAAPDAEISRNVPDAESPPRALDAGRDGGQPDGPAPLPDASSTHYDPSAFAEIQPGHGDTLPTPKGKWTFDTATGGCVAPYTVGSHTLFDGKQAGSRSFCFVQLVANKITGLAYVQDGLHLWWRWNGVDQWTPEVTGDPRNPTPAPPLGPNKLKDLGPSSAIFGKGPWGAVSSKAMGCYGIAKYGCNFAAQQVSPEPGGYSLKITTDGVTDALFETVFGVTVGKTYLMSAWTTGSSSYMQMDHDPGNPARDTRVPPSAGWVQTFCKHLVVKPDPSPTDPQKGSLWLKNYVGKNASLTYAAPYAGEVDPGYPAPKCY